MSTVTLLIVIVVVVVVVAAAAVAAAAYMRKRRSDRLREEFGPEYERTMRTSDDPREAEADLRRREKQRSKVELRELEPGERDRYRERWDSVQREFVDDPGRAVEHADGLVVEVMTARGYPAEDVDRRADDLSVDFPVITQRYREAREVSDAHRTGRADTEDLRGAVTSYRELVHALLDDTDGRDGASRGGATAALDPRDGDRGRDSDRGRAGDRDLDRDGDRARDRDLDRDRGPAGDLDRHDEHGRNGEPDRRRGADSDIDRDRDRGRGGDGDLGDRDAGADRNGDRGGDRDNRRLRDTVRDKVTGRDGDDRSAQDADPRADGGRRARDDRGRPWERGRHAARGRSDDDPRRQATT